MNFTQSAEVETKPLERKTIREKGFKIPDAVGTKEDYVLSLKSDAPFENFQLGGVSFDKYLIPNEASYTQNAEKYYEKNILVRKFAQNQADAVAEELQKREKEIPCRQNQKFRGIDTPNESEYLPAFCVKVSDYVIFKKMREYSPNPAFVSAIDPQIQKKEDVEAQSNDVFGKQFKRKG